MSQSHRFQPCVCCVVWTAVLSGRYVCERERERKKMKLVEFPLRVSSIGSMTHTQHASDCILRASAEINLLLFLSLSQIDEIDSV